MRPIISYFAEIISKSDNPIVVEIGACDGFHSQILCSLLRNNNGKPFKIHSFEPVPSLYDSWLGWTSHHRGHIDFFQSAVGVVDGVVPFFFSSGKDYYGSSSLRRPMEHMIEKLDGIQFSHGSVNSTRLDTHAQQNGLDYITFIWADVQGAERDVIEGGRNILEKTAYFYTEYDDSEEYEGEYNLQQIKDMLGDHWEIVETFQEQYEKNVLFRNNNVVAKEQ